MHVPNEPDTALDLFKDGYETEGYKFNSKFTKDDFYEFGIKIGTVESRVKRMLEKIIQKENEIEILTERSFLNDNLKITFKEIVKNRMERLKYSFTEDKG